MIEFNIYFCIKQGKSAYLSTLELALDVKQVAPGHFFYIWIRFIISPSNVDALW
mgnify:FL=1